MLKYDDLYPILQVRYSCVPYNRAYFNLLGRLRIGAASPNTVIQSGFIWHGSLPSRGTQNTKVVLGFELLGSFPLINGSSQIRSRIKSFPVPYFQAPSAALMGRKWRYARVVKFHSGGQIPHKSHNTECGDNIPRFECKRVYELCGT